MSNIDAATRAYATAVGSAGSATRENERYMSSLEARLTALRAEFQNLSTKTIESEFVGSILDAGTALLKFGQSDIGQVIIKVGSLTTGFALLNKSLGGTLVSGLKEVGSGFVTLISSIRTGDMAMNGFAATANAAFSPASVWILGITAAVGVIYGIVKAIDAATVTTKELYEAADESKSKYESIKAELDGLSIRTDLTEEEERRLKILQAQYDIYKEMYQKDAQAAFESKYRGNVTQTTTEYDDTGFGVTTTSSRTKISIIGEEIAHYKQLEYQIGQTKKAIDDVDTSQVGSAETISSLNEQLEQQESQYLQGKQAMLDYIKDMDDFKASGNELTSQEQHLYNIMADILGLYDATGEAASNAANGIKDFEDAEEDAEESSVDLISALFDEEGKLTDLGKAALDASSDLKEMVKQQLEAERKAAAADFSILVSKIQEVGSAALYTKEQLVQMMAAAGMQTGSAFEGDLSSVYAEQVRQGITDLDFESWQGDYLNNLGYVAQKERIAQIDRQLKQLEDKKEDTKTTSGGGGSSKTPIDTLKEELSLIDDQVKLSENRNEQESERIALYRSAQDKIKTLEDTYRKQGYNDTSKEIVELENLWYDYQKKIAEIAGSTAGAIADGISDGTDELEKEMEEQVAQQEAELQNAISQRQAEVNAFYDAEIDKLKQRNEEIEKAIDLEEKLEALEKAKSQRMLVYEDGQFKYQQNYAAIAEAQKPIDEANLQKIYDDEVARLEEQRKAELEYVAEEEKLHQRLKQLNDLSDELVRDEDFAKALVYINAEGRGTAALDSSDVSHATGASLNLADYAMGEAYSGSFMGVEQGKVYSDMIDALGKNTATVSEVKDYISQTISQDYIKRVGSTAFRDTMSVEEAKDLADEISSIQSQIGSLRSKRGYATGTTSATFGLHMLGEHGRELGLLSHGDGVIPHGITENLMKLGQYSPAELIKSIVGMFNGLVSSVINQNFGSITLPNVTDFNSFANEMKNFKNYATQNAYTR